MPPLGEGLPFDVHQGEHLQYIFDCALLGLVQTPFATPNNSIFVQLQNVVPLPATQDICRIPFDVIRGMNVSIVLSVVASFVVFEPTGSCEEADIPFF